MNKRLAMLVFLVLPIVALAGWTTPGVVDGVYSHEGAHYITTTITDNPCGTPGKFWWPTSDPDSKDMLAIAMTALAADKNVGVFHNPAAPSCANGAQLATMIYVAR
jgi:hypothetical protein